MRDIIFITIDCWRYDALASMPSLSSRVSAEEWIHTDAICQASATEWVFPQIFGGMYHPQVYLDGSQTIRADIRPLPKLLKEHGYETGGFIASNPNVDVWERYFDAWANEDLEPFYARIGLPISMLVNFALQRKRVSAKQLGQIGREWFSSASPPRFLWMHVMEPHQPYYPGLKRVIRNGIVSSYSANLASLRKNRRELLSASNSDRIVDSLKSLHYAAVSALDAQIDALLDFAPDDATVVMMGDHGEEFDHGWLEHSRLYDECVRVPFIAKNLDLARDSIRQIDVAPTILDRLGFSIPDKWEGTPADGESRPSYMIHPSPRHYGAIFTGIRTSSSKLIETYGRGGTKKMKSELYDLTSDESERTNVYRERPGQAANLEDQLHDFLDRLNIDPERYWQSEASSENRTNRLRELGYLE